MRMPFPAGPIVRSTAEYVEQPLEAEDLRAVAGARVVFANYELLAHDFPRLARSRRTAIDNWLVEHAGIISCAQSQQTVTNTRIRLSRRRVRAFRPPVYGRAVVLDTGDGLLDVKGVGVRDGVVPSAAPHCSGVLSLSVAFGEVLFEWLAAAALKKARSICEVLPSYAVIDLGFDVIEEGRDREPACALVRRAHTRPRILWAKNADPGLSVAHILRDVAFDLRRRAIDAPTKSYIVEEQNGVLTVLIHGTPFRFEGAEAMRVASLVRYRGSRLAVEPLNLQFTSGMCGSPPRPQLIDFGFYLARHRFIEPLYIPTTWSYVAMEGDVTHPDDPRYVRAPLNRRVPLSANRLGSSLMKSYVRGECSGAAIGRRLLRFVDDTLGIPKG
jgi:hypothetical protein